MIHSFIVLFICFAFSSGVNGETISVFADTVQDGSDHTGPLGQSFEVVNDGQDFYGQLSLMPFTQSSPSSFIQNDDSLRFLGQSSSQLLILEDGFSQQSSTGIGGSRSYHYLDPFFYEEVIVHLGGGATSLGMGAFSGAIELKSSMKPGQKFLLATGANGFQKIGYKNVSYLGSYLLSVEGLRSYKSGPSLQPKAQGIKGDDDQRALHVLRFKIEDGDQSALGSALQFKFFRDNQEFDQFNIDDSRPFSNEYSYELVAKKSLVINEEYLLRQQIRFGRNEREVNNVFGDIEQKLDYKSSNVLYKTSLEMLDFLYFSQANMGVEVSRDFSLSLTEVSELVPTSFSRESLFVSSIVKYKGSDILFNGRIDHSNKVFSPQISLGHKIKSKLYQFSAEFSSVTRSPSFYELFSLYGNNRLYSEKNRSISFNISRENNVSKFSLMGFYQNQKDLIYFDSDQLVYQNNRRNNFFGAGFDLGFDVRQTKINMGFSISESEQSQYQIGVSPLKAYLKFQYQINNQLEFDIEEVLYGPLTMYGGEKQNAYVFSKASFNYNFLPNFSARLSGQFEMLNNLSRNNFVQLSVQGIL